MSYEYSMVSSKGKPFKVPIDETDIIGKKFGSVTILNYDGFEYRTYNSKKRYNHKQKVHWYTVQCDCGKTWTARRSDIIRGNITTCGKCLLSNKYGSLGNLEKRRTQNGICKECNKDEGDKQ